MISDEILLFVTCAGRDVVVLDVGEVHGPEQVHHVGGDQPQRDGQVIEVERLEGEPDNQIKLHRGSIERKYQEDGKEGEKIRKET